MMNIEEAQARMLEVQRIMERTTLHTLLPGTASVVGGVLVLIGCVVSYVMIGSLDFGRLLEVSVRQQVMFCVMWTGIGVGAIALDTLMTIRAARARGISPKARPLRFAAYSLSPSIFVAVILTCRLLIDSTETNENMRYITPVWMMCYGTGVYAAGLFSIRLPRLLGLLFILAGAMGIAAFREYGIVLAASSFGGLHILFGLIVIRGQKREVTA